MASWLTAVYLWACRHRPTGATDSHTYTQHFLLQHTRRDILQNHTFCSLFLFNPFQATAYTTTFLKTKNSWKRGIQSFLHFHPSQDVSSQDFPYWHVMSIAASETHRSKKSCIFQTQPWAAVKKSRSSITDLHWDRWKEGGKKESQGSCPSWLGGRVWDNSTKSSSRFNAGLVRTVKDHKCLDDL